ncbi:MAG: glycosyltransferase [Candidatus Saccharibacteria bacterium]
MRILIANDQHWPMRSGVATAVRTLAQGLSRLGYEVLVVAPSQNSKSSTEKDVNYTIRRIRSLPLFFRKNLRVAATYDREIRKIIQDFNPDIVHVHTQLTVGLSVLKMANSLGIPVVATNHVMPDNIIKNVKALKPVSRPISHILSEYGLLLYKGVKRIIFPTESVLGLFNLERIEAPAVAISNGIDLSIYTPRKPKKYIYDKFDIPSDKKIIAWIGRLDVEKHLDVAVKSFAKLCADYADVHMLIVGMGNDESRLLDLVEELDIADRVTFTGLVSDEDKYELHRVTTIFAVPSPNELQCLSMLESMACGKPIVAVNAGALAELCLNDDDGYLVSVDDVDGFTRSYQMLLDNPDRLKKFGQRAREVAETHDTAVVMPRFAKLYAEVIAENRADS